MCVSSRMARLMYAMSPPCSLPWQGKRCVQHEVVVVVACSCEPHFHAGACVSGGGAVHQWRIRGASGGTQMSGNDRLFSELSVGANQGFGVAHDAFIAWVVQQLFARPDVKVAAGAPLGWLQLFTGVDVLHHAHR